MVHRLYDLFTDITIFEVKNNNSKYEIKIKFVFKVAHHDYGL